MNRKRKLLIWLMLLSTLISACEEVSAAPPTHLEPCIPEKNIYTDPIDSFLVQTYERAVAAGYGTSTYNNLQQQAFTYLVNRVYDWTDFVVISTGEKNIEIAITYLGSEIVQAVVINHYLYKGNTNFIGQLDGQVKNQIGGIIDRNEHIFFITFATPPSNNSVTIEFPLNELELTNTSNLTVKKEHDDHNLERPIPLQNEPEYGFFYLPMAVIQDGRCQTVIDKNRDTTIVITVPRIMINSTDFGTQSWRYKYAPLIDMKAYSNGRPNRFPIGQPADQISPALGSLSPGGGEDPNYWVSLARLIWFEITLNR